MKLKQERNPIPPCEQSRHKPRSPPLPPLPYPYIEIPRRFKLRLSMAPPPMTTAPLLFFIFFFAAAAADEKTTYVVHMAKHMMPAAFSGRHEIWYDASLRAVAAEPPEMLYTYDVAAHGFAARLTPTEARELERKLGVVAVVPEIRHHLHTTRSPEFLGLDRDPAMASSDKAGGGADVVVGVLDTGIWPERRSFDDAGFGPVPSWWKGACESGTNFNSSSCNRKLVGARFFCKGYESALGAVDESTESRSPRDDDGHGTHTASTAAGAAVPAASLLGYATGTARGMSMAARVAAYKCCWKGGCFSSDILAAIDAAVADGVKVLSLSLGGAAFDYYRDSVAVGAFNAMEKGVLVSCSAGNAGPAAYSLSNVAPWITTVGAGTLDRDFPAFAVLGNGENYTGVSLYAGDGGGGAAAVVYAGNASNATNGNICWTGTLIRELVKGKIVLCDRGVNSRVQKGAVVKAAGGAGMILANTAANGEELVADAHLLPAVAVGQKAGDAIRSYVLAGGAATASIVFGGTKLGVTPSPVVAAFSSRGPNTVTPGILKPDIIAPGVNILASWTGAAGPTGLDADDRRVEFNIISGTSMSCPHVSGLAALLMAAHPSWSPAAVRSALMTTAYADYHGGAGMVDLATGKPATPLAVGAGHVDPPRVMDPGLVYDLAADDYLSFLCALNYTALQLASVAPKRAGGFACDPERSYAVVDLNYPSFVVQFATASGTSAPAKGEEPPPTSWTVKHARTVTNVGPPGSTYNVSITAAGGGAAAAVKVEVEPEKLEFEEGGEKKSFTVSFTAGSMPSGSSGFGRLEWSDGKHVVTSPIVYTWT